MTGRPTADQISLWLDHALSEEESAEFELWLESDPQFAEEVARMQESAPRYRGNDATLRSALPADEPVPEALMARLGLTIPSPAAESDREQTPSNVVDIATARTRRARLFQPQWLAAGAIAASIALGIVMIPGAGVSDPFGSARFQSAMMQTPSQGVASLDDGKTVRPSLSFAAADGRWCREFGLADGKSVQTGVACKTSKGWTVEGLVDGGTTQDGYGAFRTAGGADPTALDAVYKRLGASDPLSGDQEKALIAKAWNKSGD